MLVHPPPTVSALSRCHNDLSEFHDYVYSLQANQAQNVHAATQGLLTLIQLLYKSFSFRSDAECFDDPDPDRLPLSTRDEYGLFQAALILSHTLAKATDTLFEQYQNEWARRNGKI